MTTSENTQPDSAYVWAWLPGASEPIVAGIVERTEQGLYAFTYGQSYLRRPDAIPLYLPELPLKAGRQEPPAGFEIAGALSDAGPDSWGQRVIYARREGHIDRDSNLDDLSRITYFLESGTDRIGGLDFQESATEYVPRRADHAADLDELVTAADRLEKGERLPHALAEALLRGTSIGGARPKALIDDGDRRLIAKFSSTSDIMPVVKAEAVAMDLARRAGVNAAAVEVARVLGKDVLLVERFDRPATGGRKLMVSALTILQRQEILAHHASYTDIADQIRARFTDSEATLRELFTRIIVNIAVGNTDDHLRNHAAFWDGSELTLTPAYDIAPQLRPTPEANQALLIGKKQRQSRFAVAVDAAEKFHLSRSDATEIVDHVVDTIRTQWDDAADQAQLTTVEREALMGRQILNAWVFTK